MKCFNTTFIYRLHLLRLQLVKLPHLVRPLQFVTPSLLNKVDNSTQSSSGRNHVSKELSPLEKSVYFVIHCLNYFVLFD